MKRILALALVSFTAACGGGGGGDDTSTPDAEVGDDPDSAVEHTCFADPSYSAPLGNQGATSGGGTAAAPNGVTAQGTLTAAEPFDILQLELIKGYGVYTADITVGEHTLSGDELNYATCGLCPRLFTDCTADTCNDQQFYATGGTINVTSITPNLTFTATNLTFVEVTIEEGTFVSTPVPGGCSTGIASASFDAANTHTP
jgi:hypothetical protein